MLRDAQPGTLARVAWVGGIAHVWTWLPSDDASAREKATWVPESLLRARPSGDGPRLIALMEGVEGQVWREGDMVASQWWPSPPTEQVWHRFVRYAGLAPDVSDTLPSVDQAGWSAPWARLRGAAGGPDVLEAMAWRAVMAGVALALGWQVMARDDEREVHAVLLARTEALRLQATPLLDARERADAAYADIERFRDLQRASSDYSLMPAVTIPLGEDARLLGWQRHGDVLKAKVAVNDVDPRRAVDAYTRVGLLADVQATPLPPDAVGLEFKLPETFRIAGGDKDDGGRNAGTQE